MGQIQTITIDKKTLPPSLTEYFSGPKITVEINPRQIVLARTANTKAYSCPIRGILKDDPVPLTELEIENDIEKELDQ